MEFYPYLQVVLEYYINFYLAANRSWIMATYRNA